GIPRSNTSVENCANTYRQLPIIRRYGHSDETSANRRTGGFATHWWIRSWFTAYPSSSFQVQRSGGVGGTAFYWVLWTKSRQHKSHQAHAKVAHHEIPAVKCGLRLHPGSSHANGSNHV